MCREEKQVREAFNRLAGEWDERAVSSPDKIRYLLSFLTIPLFYRFRCRFRDRDINSFLREKMGSSGLIVELDVAEEMLEVAKRKFGEEGIEYHQGSAERYKDSRRYDLVIVYSSFPHFWDRDLALQNLISLLIEEESYPCPL